MLGRSGARPAVPVLLPTGLRVDGDSATAWTPSTPGDHYTLIAENGADAADYVESDVNGAADMFTLADLPTAGGIYAVKLQAETRNETGGTPTLDVRLDSGGNVEETSHVVDDTAAYRVFNHLSETDPATAAAWEAAGVNALLAGVQMNS